MEQSQLLTHCGSSKITREELKVIPTPAGSATHQPLPHFEIVGALVETLSFRQISVVREEYAVTSDDMKMFRILDLETTFDGCRFSVGVRKLQRQVHEACPHRRLQGARVRQHGVPWRFHASAGEARNAIF
jgi:hypothetical protein